MKKFAVSYMNYFDNKLTMSIIEADSYREAIKSGLVTLGGWLRSDVDDYFGDYLKDADDSELGQYFFDSDFQCEAMEV